MIHKTLTIKPISYINGSINLPGSKSISNRALLLAAQASGTTILKNLLFSDDTYYMLSALRMLNVQYVLSKNDCSCTVYGLGKPLGSNIPLNLFLGNAGTAMRPLAAALCLCTNNIILTGIPRMKERPIKHLSDALQQGGAKIEYIEKYGYPPIKLYGGYTGGEINIDGGISSQFLSAVLMMAPMAPENTYIYIKGKLVSQPYISLTLKIMKTFGIEVKYDSNYKRFYIQGNRTYLSPGEYVIEGDASSASYFLAASAIRGGTVRVYGINKNSMQGDIKFANILQKMGAEIYWGDNYVECKRNILQSIDMDMNDIPDSAMTIAIVALFVQNKSITILRNIYNWRVKETDRLCAMSIELKKIGAYVVENRDHLIVGPPKEFISSTIETYNDHRIAMCFTLIALSGVSIKIINPNCTNKTFPDFFNQFNNISVFN